MDASHLQVPHVWALVLLMLGASILGGSINHFFYAEKKDEKLARRTPWLACVLISAGAAFLVPLFLTMIASSLVKDCEADQQKYLVFFGFCVIAAISSRAFIGSMSMQVLDRIRRAEEKIEQVEPLVEKAKEPRGAKGEEAQDVTAKDAAVYAHDKSRDGVHEKGHDENLGEKMRVLRELSKTDYVFRTVDSVAENASLETGMCKRVLRSLRDEGLVNKMDDVDGVRWYLLGKGREFLEHERVFGAHNGAAHTGVG